MLLMNENKTATIIILLRNGRVFLRELFSAISSQETQYEYKILCIDHNSSDGSREFVTDAGHEVHSIGEDEFHHARTRNYAVTLCPPSQFVVFVSQDTVPVGKFWLENLLKELENDPGLKAVGARIYSLDKKGILTEDPFEEKAVSLLRTPRYLVSSFPGMSSVPLKNKVYVSNVCAAYRIDYLKKYPFDDSFPIGEDTRWMVAASERGYEPAQATRSCIIHKSNHHSAFERWERLRLFEWHDALLFNDTVFKRIQYRFFREKRPFLVLFKLFLICFFPVFKPVYGKVKKENLPGPR